MEWIVEGQLASLEGLEEPVDYPSGLTDLLLRLSPGAFDTTMVQLWLLLHEQVKNEWSRKTEVFWSKAVKTQ